MYFHRGQAGTFEVEEKVSIAAKPALGGIIFYVQMKGRPTQYGIGAVPLYGTLQFTVWGKEPLPWPTFEFKQGGQPNALREQGSEYLHFEGLLSHAQLEAFEKARNGKDFDVGVRASLSVLNSSGAVENWHIQDSHLHKTAQEWLTILSNSGFKKYLFLEMAFPTDVSAGPDSALRHLLKARELFDKGLYRECVTNLRMAQEQLRNKRGDKAALDEAKRLYKEKREDMNLGQRLLFAREAVHNALQLGAHPEEDETAFDREKAKALLVMVSALLELYPEPNGISEE